jgi:8-oxo-dGTP pyrophosphatase MutT (NUDIX family)
MTGNGMKESKSLEWERVDSEPGPELIIFRSRFDRLRNPANGRVFRRVVLESVDWVNVVAITPDGKLVMVEQYRFGIGRNTVETPGGMVDPGETSLQAAKRELVEETGFAGARWRYLGAVEPNPAVHDHLCHHWLVEDAVKTGDPDPGDGEALAVRLMTQAEVVHAFESGRLRHVLALSALSRVLSLWPLPYIVSGLEKTRR